MIRIGEVEVDATIRGINAVFRQIRFAATNALNDTVFEARDTERNLIEGDFIVRREWVLQGIQVPKGAKATRDNLETELVLEAKRDFLAKFEEGGIKRPRGGHSLAVPHDESFRRSQVVPKGKRPKALAFKLHRTSTGKAQFKGEQRTFIIEKSTFERGIFQRIGRGRRSDIRLLYWLTRAALISPDLHMERTAREVAVKSYQRHFNRRFIEALRTARL